MSTEIRPKFSFEVVKSTLEAIVAKARDFVYQGAEGAPDGYCLNTDIDGNPSCVVGQLVGKLDPSLLAEVYEFEWKRIDDVSGEDYGITTLSVDGIQRRYSTAKTPIFDEPSVELLSEVQRLQDAGNTWGEALNMAEEYVASTVRWQ